MSQVYFARDLNLKNDPVVVKVLSQDLVQDSYAQRKFDQEVEALLRIRHRGVVGVRDTGKLDNGRPYIVMQYVDGDTLRSRIPADGMNLKRAAFILKQIGAALKRVHRKGIVHRDLKPENIMLRRGTDSVVLIDFGIAKVNDSVVAAGTAAGASPGTIVYMSPEQLRGEEITAASDIYAMAVIAYEMITGRRPVNPASAALRPSLSRAQKLILQGLSFDAKSRPQNAKRFGKDLYSALTGMPFSIPKPGKIVTALVIASLLSFGAYWYFSKRPTVLPPSRGLNFWLIVQRMREGKEYEEPIKSNGADDIFESGDKFQLNVETLEAGYLYIFNERAPEPNNNSFLLVYPIKTTNNGTATIGANQTVRSEWSTFRGPASSENFWIVWSASPVDELELAKNQALRHPQAALTDQNLIRLKEFLKTTQDRVDVNVRRYKDSKDARARAKSDIVLTLAQYKHR